MEITYEKICTTYNKKLKNDMNPILKNIIEEIYNGLYDLDNIILNDEVNSGDIYFWIGNYCKDIIKNYEKVKKYYLMAIGNGNIEGMFNLGLYYDDIENNYEEMKKYYLMAIESGDGDAMNNLGMYYENIGNYEEMKKYYLMSIENGNSEAMNNLGNYYYYYENIENYEEMKKYYLMSIENGNSEAMDDLCKYYDDIGEPIENLYIELVNINNKNEIIDNKITELLNEYEHLKDVYISPILK